MNRRPNRRDLKRLNAVTLAAMLVLFGACLWAAPPAPEPPRPTEPTEITIDEDALRLGEDYLDLVKELEAVLTDFEEFYQEAGLASLTGIAKSAKIMRQSLQEDPPKATHEELVKNLDEMIDRMDTVIEEAEDGDSQMRRRYLRELQSFSEDLSDIRDQFDSDFTEQQIEKLFNAEKMAEIFEKAAHQAEKAMQLALSQQKGLDSEYILIPPTPPKPFKGKIGVAARAKGDYYILKAQHEYDDSLTQTATMTVDNRQTIIELRNDIGGIEVHTWNRSEAAATLTINYSSGSSSSRTMAKDIRLVASNDNKGVLIRIDYPDDESKTVGIVSSQLDVSVPAANPVKIENSFGSAVVADLQNSLTVSSNFGSVETKRITGDVTINSSTGAVYVEDVTGRLEVSSSFGDMEVVDVIGAISLSNSYATVAIRNSIGNLTIANSGAVSVSGHTGEVTVESSNGEVEIYKLTGNLTAANSFGGMQIESVTGQVTAENSSAALEISEVGGPVEATNRFGSIEINDAKGAVRAESSNSEISITQAGGGVTIINRFGKVTVKGAGGAVQIDNTNAVVDVSNVLGSAVITNQFAPVVVANVTGTVEVDNQNASVDLTDIGGAVTVRTTFGEVSGENLKGPFEIDNANGSVAVSRLTSISKDCLIRAVSGDITIELPPAGGYNVDASTSWGKIQTDLPMKLSSGGNIMSGEYMAGANYPTLTLKGENSSIIISTRP